MNSYFVCNNCSLNLQEIPIYFSRDDFFKIQQDHYFSDSAIFNSRLMNKIEAEENLPRPWNGHGEKLRACAKPGVLSSAAFCRSREYRTYRKPEVKQLDDSWWAFW